MNRENKDETVPDRLALRRSLDGSACSIKRALEIVGEQWTLLILREAFWGVRRFSDFQQFLHIPKAVLSARLERLVGAGILETRSYKEEGARLRHEYHLTSAGVSLLPALLALMQWGDEHLGEGPTRVVDRKTGYAVQVRLTDIDGRPVEATDVRAVPSG